MSLGPYAGSVLRFTLTFPLSFPRARPAVHFETDVFHREFNGLFLCLASA